MNNVFDIDIDPAVRDVWDAMLRTSYSDNLPEGQAKLEYIAEVYLQAGYKLGKASKGNDLYAALEEREDILSRLDQVTLNHRYKRAVAEIQRLENLVDKLSNGQKLDREHTSFACQCSHKMMSYIATQDDRLTVLEDKIKGLDFLLFKDKDE